MSYPPYFYYSEKSSESQFSLTPQGSLDVGQLINGRPYWKIDSESSRQQPKSLILADWTAANWSKEKIEEIIVKLSQLMADGFTIYIWKAYNIEQLTPDSLYLLREYHCREEITAQLPETILKCARTRHPKLTKTNTEILDDYTLNNLIHNTDASIRSLDVSDLTCNLNLYYLIKSMVSRLNINLICSNLKKAVPPLTKIIHSEYSWGANKAIDMLAKQFPLVPIEIQYRKLELNTLQIEQLLRDKLVLINGVHFAWSELHQIEELILKDITRPQLQQILAHTPKLKNLKVHYNKNLPPLEQKDIDITVKLPFLEHLWIINFPISSLELRQLFANAPRLKKLDFELSKIPGGLPEDITLPSLEYITLDDKAIIPLALQHLLAHSPKLKSLDLSGNAASINAEGLKLPFLEHLRLNRVTSSELLNKILDSSPRINNITIYSCPALADLHPTDTPLLSLHELTIFNSPISPVALRQLLINAPNLRELRLNNCCPDIADLNGHELNSLMSLHTLNISGSPISEKTQHQLLIKMSNLRSLDLSFCPKLKNFEEEPINLPFLQWLKMAGSSMSLKELQKFLSGMPKLEKLLLYNCTNLADITDEVFYLPFLQDLDLESSNISEQGILRLLAGAPNLQQLSLNPKQITDCSLKTQKLLVAKKLYVADDKGELQPVVPQVELDNKLTKADQEPFLSTKAVDIHEPSQADPIHNPQSLKHFQPTKEDFTFKFKGENKTLNQGMVIEKLSHYLTLTNQHVADIPKLQDGICNALSHHFLSMDPASWNALMTGIQQWNGRRETLTTKAIDLRPIFDTLLKTVKDHQFSHGTTDKTYLGDNLMPFLAQQRGPLILSSAWHAVALTYSATPPTWTVYDPNFVEAPRTAGNLDELEALLKKCLGALIFVENKYPIAPLIKNPQTFLRDGGLLALVQATNETAMLDQLPSNTVYTREALDGLLLRDTSGNPTWIRGIKDPFLASYTLSLLHQFSAKNTNYLTQLQHSMEALSPHERHEAIVVLSQLELAPSTQSKYAALLDTLRVGLRSQTSKDYSAQLETWRRATPPDTSLQAYCLEITKKTKDKSRLIECKSSQSVETLSLEVLRHCKSTSRPVFYINSPDDLICSASWVQRVTGTNQGILQKGPGGPLHEFLTQNKGKDSVVLVNYDRFKADDLVRFNSLLDKERLADGTPLPTDTLVLGFINPHKPGSYQGADFYSRFDSKETCPLSTEQLSHTLPGVPPTTRPWEDAVRINLGHAQDWEERLLGRWLIKKDQLVFEEGALEQALRANKPIQIQNGLWSNPRFQFMWQQAIIRGEITHAGRTITLPKDLVWSQHEGYDWVRLTSLVSFAPAPSTKPPVIINPKLLSTLFRQYQCDAASATLDSIPGLLELNKNSTLTVHLTRTLSDDEWSLLLSECAKHQVKLSCQLAPGVTLPEALTTGITVQEPVASRPWSAGMTTNPLIITSTDTSTTLALLTHKEADWMVIDVSECDASLLSSIDGGLNPDATGFAFHKKIGALLQGLEENKKIVLHGHFSTELLDSLAPLLLNPLTKGRLVLVSETAKPFNYCPVVHHEVSLIDKQQCLKNVLHASAEELTALESKVTTLSYSALDAHLRYQRAFPKAPGNPWAGMDAAPLPVTMEAFDAEHCAEKTQAFIQKRLSDVNAVLTHASYVYLTGPTAVGKSTFVEKHLAAQPGVTLYSGESQMHTWAESNVEGTKVLFIDEANITTAQWSQMEGLFNTPPGMLINNRYYPLTPSHKVVFAGNPLNYGGERQLAPLFARHGNAVPFGPLSLELIHEHMLKPVFAGTPLEPQTLALVAPILAVYRFIGQQPRQDVLISPRELQMMALMVASYAKQHPQATAADHRLAARHYAYRLGRHLNGEAYKEAFDAEFKPLIDLPHEALPPQPADFIVTASRKEISQQLDDVLALRQFRQTTRHETQQYGGLGGIILEGEPGGGKSEMVLAALRAREYKEVHAIQGHPNRTGPDKPFYRMPVSMQNSDKEKLLRKAFHEGAVVIIDEINSAPMMERLLNALLMGKTPEGERPEKPGFLVIGTQNPVSMDGRQAPSTALARRLITTPLPAYPPEKEMKAILVSKGVPPTEASLMVDAYEKNRIKAQQEHLTPAPTFRDLLRLAQRVSLKTEALKLNEQIKNLFQQIRSLYTHGQTLTQQIDKISQQEGQKAIELAVKLTEIAQGFNQHEVSLGEQKNYRTQFSSALSQGYKDLATHRALWKPILANIVIAATVIGLLLLIGKVLVTGHGFFTETKRQQKVQDITTSFLEFGQNSPT